MNIEELKLMLNRLHIRSDAYSLEGEVCDECYILLKEGTAKWEVYYSERGVKLSSKTFNNEAEACEELFRRLENDPTVKKC